MVVTRGWWGREVGDMFGQRIQNFSWEENILVIYYTML
jgi:hypothetical protein